MLKFQPSTASSCTEEKSKLRVLQLSLGLMVSFLIVEWLTAVITHSLSLLADVAHIFSDVVALGITLLTHYLNQRWHNHVYHSEKFGSRMRASSALINGLGLLAVALWIAHEAILSLKSPTTEIEGLPMLLTASVGIGINSFNAHRLHPCSHHDLNFRGALFHTLADIISSLGVLVAAIAIVWLHWNWADGVISLLVSSLILLMGAKLMWDSIYQFRFGYFQTPQPDCNCDNRQQMESLLFPTLEANILKTSKK